MNFWGESKDKEKLSDEAKEPSSLIKAKNELEAGNDLFYRIAAICNKKCVNKYHDGELAVGEMTCIDRCTGKYLEAHESVNSIVKAFQASLAAQQEAQSKLE